MLVVVPVGWIYGGSATGFVVSEYEPAVIFPRVSWRADSDHHKIRQGAAEHHTLHKLEAGGFALASFHKALPGLQELSPYTPQSPPSSYQEAG
jgi:hypothetical protein